MTEAPGIYRNELEIDGNFTTVCNEWIRNSGLSPQANYLWSYLLSHRIGYELRDSQILNETGFGRKGLRAARSELVEAGWLVLTRMKNADGSLGTYAYQLQVTRDPSGTVAEGTVEQGTVAEGSDYIKPISNKTKPKKTITKKETPKTADDYEPSPDRLERWRLEYPYVSIDTELQKFKDYYMAAGRTWKDYDRAFANWLRRATKYSPEARAASVRAEEMAKIQRIIDEEGI